MSQDPQLEYLGSKPQRLPYTKLLSAAYLKILLWKSLHSLRQPFLLFNSIPINPKDLPDPGPGASLSEEHLDFAKKSEMEANKRHEILEQKADKILGVLVFVTPLYLSVVTYVLHLTDKTSVLTVVLFSLTGACVIAGFVAALRAAAIRYHQKLGIGAIFDASTGTWLPLPREKMVRGLMYCATWNEAINDHVADFVNAARLYAAIAMVSLVCASLTVLGSKVPSDSQAIALQSITNAVGNLSHSVDSLKMQIQISQKTIASSVQSDSKPNGINTLVHAAPASKRHRGCKGAT